MHHGKRNVPPIVLSYKHSYTVRSQVFSNPQQPNVTMAAIEFIPFDVSKFVSFFSVFVVFFSLNFTILNLILM